MHLSSTRLPGAGRDTSGTGLLVREALPGATLVRSIVTTREFHSTRLSMRHIEIYAATSGLDYRDLMEKNHQARPPAIGHSLPACPKEFPSSTARRDSVITHDCPQT